MKIRKMKIRNRKIRNRKANNHCKPNVTEVHVYTVSIVNFNLHKILNIPAHFIGMSVILTVLLWQSQVEIEHYSIAHLDNFTTAFKVLQCITSVKD